MQPRRDVFLKPRSHLNDMSIVERIKYMGLCYSHTVANILANMKIWNSRQIRRKWYDWPGEILKKIRPNGYESLRISYECPCESCDCLRMPLRIICECYECLRMPLWILRMLANALRIKRLHNACVANCIYTPCQCFTLSLIRQPPPNPLRILWIIANALMNLAKACEHVAKTMRICWGILGACF
jgi:hypothetical protein